MRRVDALDGLRALALLMVIAYHMDKELFPAGHWGVVVFFVLSGYLITRLLCQEMDESGRVDLKSFYAKRAIRLYPALVLMCLVLVAFGLDWRRTLPALGQYANYARIAGAELGVLTHTWFLAAMAHFYLFWPLVLGRIPKRRRIVVIGLLLFAAVVWRAVTIWVASPGWVYNATDTNAAALLAGCFLGVVKPRSWRLAGISIPGLALAMLLPVFGEEGAGFFWGHFLAIALGLMAVQYAVGGAGWMGSPVMGWLGEISYGLYLWHYVFVGVGVGVVPTLILSLAVAALSYYWIETPTQSWLARVGRRRAEKAIRRDLVESTNRR
ncbi:MAG TPA: acyltransferase [Acidimicrobiia bacterium]